MPRRVVGVRHPTAGGVVNLEVDSAREFMLQAAQLGLGQGLIAFALETEPRQVFPLTTITCLSKLTAKEPPVVALVYAAEAADGLLSLSPPSLLSHALYKPAVDAALWRQCVDRCLGGTDFQHLLRSLQGALHAAQNSSAVLSRDQFDRAIRELLPRDSLSPLERLFLSHAFGAVWRQCNRGSGAATAIEIMAGLAIYCTPRHWLDKLSSLLELSPAGWQRQPLWLLFRGLGASLQAVCAPALAGHSAGLASMDDVALRSVSAVFDRLDPRAGEGSGIAEVADILSAVHSGDAALLWLRCLSAERWPRLELRQRYDYHRQYLGTVVVPTMEEDAAAAAEDAAAATPPSVEGSDAPPTLPMPVESRSVPAESRSPPRTSSPPLGDADGPSAPALPPTALPPPPFEQLLRATRLWDCSPAAAAACINALAERLLGGQGVPDAGTAADPALFEALLLPSPSAQHSGGLLWRTVQSLVQLLQLGEARTAHTAGGLSDFVAEAGVAVLPLSGLSKSELLGVAWEHIAGRQQTAGSAQPAGLDEGQLAQLLRSLLCGIVALAAAAGKPAHSGADLMPPTMLASVAAVVDTSLRCAVEEVFAAHARAALPGATAAGRLTLADFATVYNDNPHTAHGFLSFLELANTRKWLSGELVIGEAVADVLFTEGAVGAEPASCPPVTDMPTQHEAAPPLPTEAVTPLAAQAARAAAELSGLGLFDAVRFDSRLLAEPPYLPSELAPWLAAALQPQLDAPPAACAVAAALMPVCFALAQSCGSAAVPPLDCVAMALLLCSGSKSDKLSVLLQAAAGSEVGRVTQTQLALVFLAVLHSLAAIQVVGDCMEAAARSLGGGHDELPSHSQARFPTSETRQRAIAVACAADAFAALREVHAPSTASHGAAVVDLAMLGAWYNEVGGGSIASFLELLSLRKLCECDGPDAGPGRLGAALHPADVATLLAYARESLAESARAGASEPTVLPPLPHDDPVYVFEFFHQPSSSSSPEELPALRLELSAADCQTVHAVAHGSGLALVESAVLCASLLARATPQGTVTLPTLLAAVEEHCMRGAGEASSPVVVALQTFFRSFCPPGQGEAPAYELATGMLLFSRGGKSAKLAAAWALFSSYSDMALDGGSEQRADEPTAGLSPVQLSRLLAVSLYSLAVVGDVTLAMMMHGQGSPPSSGHAAALRPALNSAALALAGSILSSVGAAGSSGSGPRVSFREFSSWYNATPRREAAWLELLSLRKWPVEASAPVASDSEADAWAGVPLRSPLAPLRPQLNKRGFGRGAERADGKSGRAPSAADVETMAPPPPAAADLADLVYCFPLLFDALSNDPTYFLVVSSHHVARHAALASEHLPRADFDTTLQLLERAADSQGLVDCEAFSWALTALDAGNSGAGRLHAATRGRGELVGAFAARVFAAVGACTGYAGGLVPAELLVAGASPLLSGSKSQKLAAMWRAMGIAETSSLGESSTQHALRCLFGSTLAGVAALAAILAAPNSDDAPAVVVQTCAADATRAFLALSARDLSFEAFAGSHHSLHAQLTWLELLDASKWALGATTAVAAVAATDGVAATDAAAADAAETAVAAPGDGTPCLTFPLPHGPPLLLTLPDVELLLRVSRLSALESRTVGEVWGCITRGLDPGAASLSLPAFRQVMTELVEASALTHEEQHFLSLMLGGLFFAVAAADAAASDGAAADLGAVQPLAFLAALSVLVGGNKSDKLSALFAAAGSDALSQHQLGAVLRGMLVAVQALPGMLPEGEGAVPRLAPSAQSCASSSAAIAALVGGSQCDLGGLAAAYEASAAPLMVLELLSLKKLRAALEG